MKSGERFVIIFVFVMIRIVLIPNALHFLRNHNNNYEMYLLIHFLWINSCKNFLFQCPKDHVFYTWNPLASAEVYNAAFTTDRCATIIHNKYSCLKKNRCLILIIALLFTGINRVHCLKRLTTVMLGEFSFFSSI